MIVDKLRIEPPEEPMHADAEPDHSREQRFRTGS